MSKNSNLEQLVDKIDGISIFAIDSIGTILEWNRASQKLFGYSQEEALNKNIYDLIIQEHQIESFKSDIKNKIDYSLSELEFRRKDNSILVALTNTTFVKDRCFFLVFNSSLNKKPISIKKLIDKNATTDDKLIVISFDKNFKITSFNTFAQQSLGYREKEILGKDFLQTLIPASYAQSVKDQIKLLSKNRRANARLNFPVICKNGDKKVIKWDQAIRGKKANEEFYFLMGLTTSNDQEELSYLANYDTLTDLPNQTLLNKRLEEAISTAVRMKQNMITLFLNIENFKSINHTFGFEFGNKVLKAISNRLCSNLRDYDTIARFSGDEFVLIFENIVDDNAAISIGDRICKLFEEPFSIDGNNIELKTNQGLCFFPAHGNDAKTLIRNANLAMNHAKKSNKSFQIFTSAISEEITKKAVLENNLKKAIENEEFFLEYQPQVDTKSKKITGAEALIRWNHPKLKNIPPLDFIPLAEDNGMICKIGKIVLRDALKQANIWHKNGFDDFKISINISGVQLLQSDIVSTIDEALKESGFNPSFLELELTETVLMHNIELASEIMKKLAKKGIAFSIDDFGTGYSSFGYLSKLPLNTLKIDKSFIDHITAKQNDLIITEAIISMAHSLNLEVIAEGVENLDQYKLLSKKNCDTIQGYYFGTPLSAEKFTTLLKEGIKESGTTDDIQIVDDGSLKEYKI